MGTYRKILLALLLGLIFPGIVAAEWSLNPFAKKSQQQTVGSAGDTGWGWWPGNQKQQQAPSLWPVRPKTNPSLWPQQNSAQSTWNKMMQGTKSAFEKTADLLNPFDDANDPPKFNPTGARGISNTTKKPAQAPWWAPYSTPEPERPTTVNDFLKQKRPGFDN